MNAAQRMRAMVEGKPVDRIGVSAWKHFYLEDRDPTDFIKRTVGFQEMYGWDFIKVSYNGYLMPEAFGADIAWSPDSNTFPTMLKHNVNHPAEWEKLRPASVKDGALRREIEATARMVEHFKGEVPVLPTIFSPLTAAQEMSCGWLNPWPIMADIEYSPNELHKGLEIIAETTERFLEELCKVGIDGVFFATQLACYNRTTREQYDEFGRKYDLQLLNSIKDKTWFNMVHIHGAEGGWISFCLDVLAYSRCGGAFLYRNRRLSGAGIQLGGSEQQYFAGICSCAQR